MPTEILTDVLLPIMVIAMAMMVPIVAILTKHQRSMAELYRTERSTQAVDQKVAQENDSLRREMAELKALMCEQSIAIDNLGKRGSGEIAERMENKL